MIWIFPKFQKWMLEIYRKCLRLVFWHTSQKLKGLKVQFL